MTEREYLQHQCDKCKEYPNCPFLDAFLKLWINNREFKEYVSDGCDLAKCCTKFRKEGLCNELSPLHKLPCTLPEGHKGNHKHFPFVWANESGIISGE